MPLPARIDISHPERYILSVAIADDSFACSVFEPRQGKSFYYEALPFSTKGALSKRVEKAVIDNDFLCADFKKTNVVFVNRQYELVPNYIFERKYMDRLFRFTHVCKAEETVLCNPKDVFDNQLLFSADSRTVQYLQRTFHNPQFFHHAALLAADAAERIKGSQSTSQLAMNIHSRFCDLFTFSDSKLQHAVTFADKTPSDMVYYALSLWEKCQFDQQEDTLYVFSDRAGAEQIVHELARYVQHVILLSRPSELSLLTRSAEQAPLYLLPFVI